MTPTTQAGALVLKTDVLGRVKTPAARREGLLDIVQAHGNYRLASPKPFGLLSPPR